MPKLQRYFHYLIAGVLFIVGSGHFLIGEIMTQMLPDFLPWPLFWVYFSGVVELLLGAGLLTKAARKWSAWLVMAMLWVYLPLHVLDLFREPPVIGPFWVAVVRVPVQFLMIWMTWVIARDADQDRSQS